MTRSKEPRAFDPFSKREKRTRRVLSVQSHVIHGYVGNKAATFPLQYRGWDVDGLNTVQFSNHPGYGRFTGFRSQPNEIYEIMQKGLLEGLQMEYDAILTGYLPSVESLQITAKVVGALCRREPHINWILDPVLGDNGKLYVAEENVPAYKQILRENDVYVVTPNQFEMETLSGVKIDSLQSLRLSFELFHEAYPRVEKIVVTSLEFPSSADIGEQYIYCACFDTHPASNAMSYFKIHKLDAQFSGSGDLFNALLLDCIVPAQKEDAAALPTVLRKVLLLVDKILRRTLELSVAEDAPSQQSRVIKDLKLIQCAELLHPDRRFEDFEAAARITESILD
ncbi:hypothetical protein HG536_0A09070 [Torulaspora globosa]|uniref:pyridoxal kinase n=1 Tax=Torulaspora globosa TaxID=48254 RepID=A0A7G3ZC54_9SACH|nr:uncharacterized protein HG536_0A09070 [Torulaspora globosa]QLL31090.1 hypothetical protein HG536_0A09070 [Torulaspora globosa]